MDETYFVVIVETKDGRTFVSEPITEVEKDTFARNLLSEEKKSVYIPAGKVSHYIPGDTIALMTFREITEDDDETGE